MQHEEELKTLFSEVTQQLNPELHSGRVITFEDFKKVIDRKMDEAYVYGQASIISSQNQAA